MAVAGKRAIDSFLQRMVLAGIAISLVFGVRLHLFEDQWWGLFLYGTAALFLAFWLLQRNQAAQQLATRLLGIGIYLELWLFGLFAGGFAPVIHVWLVVLPLAASLRSSARSAIAWSLAVFVQILSLIVYGRNRELVGPVGVIDDGDLLSAVFLVALLCSFGIVYRRNRDRAEQALRASEAKLSAIVETSHDLVVVLRGDGTPLWMSPAAGPMLGISTQGATIETITRVVEPSDLKRLRARFSELTRGEIQAFQEEARLLDQHGRLRDTVLSASPLNDGSGNQLITITDITGLRSAQREATRSQQAVVQAERLESVGVLAAGIAHDFNNLLTGVLGNVSMARALSQDEGIRPHLIAAEEACRESTRLANQLLTFAKGGTPVLAAGALEPVVEEAANFGLVGSNSTTRIVSEREVPPVAIDAGQIGQVFTNLFLNSAQAMPDGGLIHVHIDTVEEHGDPQLEPGSYVRTVVTDAGCGIPESVIDRVFDPYFTTKGSGNGLGLASAHYIVQNHGGTIRIRSTVGKGTAVTVLLPVSDEPVAQSARASISLPPHEFRGRALIMDDESNVRFILAEMLRRLGFEVVATSEGQSAIDAYMEATDDPFQLIVLDLTIAGGVGGLETVQRLRHLGCDLPILVSSGYSNDDVVANYRQHGFTATLPKPYQLDDLHAVLEPLFAASAAG